MSLIVVSDIFGYTTSLQKLSETIESFANVVNIVDPYDGKIMNFSDEKEAYHYFTKHVGLTTYIEKLKSVVNSCTEKTILLGFSVGASAIWQLSKNTNNSNIQVAFGFYGSQIRHQTEICPCFPIELIFPKSESHFCVTDLINKLREKFKDSNKYRHKVTLTQVEYLHGFMNECSSNYNQHAYQHYCDWLNNTIKELKL